MRRYVGCVAPRRWAFLVPLAIGGLLMSSAIGTAADPVSSPPELVAPVQPASDVGDAGVVPASLVDGGPAASRAPDVESLYLRIDGNLPGIVNMLDPDGVLVPTRATVSLVRHGKVVQSVRTEETGVFQLLGVEPGHYSVVAVGNGGFAAMTIRILRFHGSSTASDGPGPGSDPPADDLLRVTLVPSDDYQAAEADPDDLPPEDLPPEFMPEMTAPMYGGGGGGGGLGALAGLAGLAGLGGGGGGFGGGGGGPASPNIP